MIAGDIREVVHREPVWRERSNFFISGELPENARIFRAYRRLAGARRDIALAAPTADGLAAQITQAEQAPH